MKKIFYNLAIVASGAFASGSTLGLSGHALAGVVAFAVLSNLAGLFQKSPAAPADE
jgi:hypothetical protein